MNKIQVVVGAQFGSEAKGHVTHRLTRRALARGEETCVVRVAGPNAGHTVYDQAGVKFALRQIPVAAVEHGALMMIAAGSEIDPEVLLDEIARLEQNGHRISNRLMIDAQATVITDEHKDTEDASRLVGRIGSTGKGIGAARADRVMRKATTVGADSGLVDALLELGVVIGDTAQALRVEPGTIIIEGTQGYGLGLHTRYYPQVTSSDCRAIDFLAMAGLSPWVAREIEVWVVARTYPIRVAGNSGPLFGETTWAELGLPEERTTVTQKIRRVGHWDEELVKAAIRANGGPPVVKVALTMVDQMFPGLAGVSEKSPERDQEMAWDSIAPFENDIGCEIALVTTSAHTALWKDERP